MHEYRRYVEREMDARHWSQSDLARAAGLGRQNINAITKDTRDVLPGIPKESTINGLARAFNVKPEVVLARVAIAMGLPASVVTTDAADLSDADLLAEIRTRMEARHDRQDDTQPRTQARSPQHSSTGGGEDGGTPGGRTPPMSELERKQAERDRRQQEADDKPLEDLLGLAADKGQRMDEDDAE